MVPIFGTEPGMVVHAADPWHTDVTRELFIPASGGYFPVGVLANPGYYALLKGAANADDPLLFLTTKVPDDFVSFSKVEIVWRCITFPANLRWEIRAAWGAVGEADNIHNESSGEGVTANGGASVINGSEHPTPLVMANLARGDYMGFYFRRHGTDVTDTLDDLFYLYGLLFTYVAEQ